MGIDDKIEDLEEKLEKTPVNKATEKERARLKSRIAELKEQKQQKKKGTGDTSGYAVKKHGDATIALVGFPSVGKSTLLNALTNAESETGMYEFTTLDVEPGMMDYRGAKIQILDVPGLIGGAAEGRGGGKQVLSVVRNTDLVVILLDPDEIRDEEIKEEIFKAGIRPNMDPPKMKVEKKDRGGIEISSTVEQSLDQETMKTLAYEKGYSNANIVLREEMDLDRFIDGLLDNRKYIPAVKAVNKCDKIEDSRKNQMREEFDLMISAEKGENLEALREMIFERMGLIRVYLKEKGEEPDKEEPLILREGDTVESALEELPGELKRRFKSAKVTGKSSKFPDQKVGKDHKLADEDILELNLKHL